MKRVRAVAYLRVSGRGQVDGDGFERQLTAINQYAAASDTKIEHVYKEAGVSGKTDADERPAFKAMMAELLSNGCRTIIVEALDRLARQYRIQEQLLIYIASKGITLIAANTGENITEAIMGDPMRLALVQIQGIFAELDKNLLVAKLRKARARIKAKTGRCEGVKPYGTLPGESATLARMQALREDGASYSTIAATLDGEGVKPRSGERWNQIVINRVLRASMQATCGDHRVHTVHGETL